MGGRRDVSRFARSDLVRVRVRARARVRVWARARASARVLGCARGDRVDDTAGQLPHHEYEEEGDGEAVPLAAELGDVLLAARHLVRGRGGD